MTKKYISKRKWLLLPIETKARELASKILFACVGAEKGFGVIIGAKSIVRGKQAVLPRGAFIEKSIAPGSMPLIAKAQANHNRVSAWCEEGLIYLSRDDYKQRRVDLESFKAVDYFFTWGQHQADDVSAIVGQPDKKIILSGNPRFDLLRPEIRGVFAKNAQAIKDKYGRIILLNTKFASVNLNSEVSNYLAYLKSLGKIKTKEQEELFTRFIDLNKKLFPIFLGLVPVLAEKYKDYTIVIRPHPSENHAPWLAKAKDHDNVKVIFEGNANEWILASELMIHNNCTTGVEAFMLEKPAISYRPVIDEVVEHPLPNVLSYQAYKQDELLSLIDDILTNKDVIKKDRVEQNKEAAKYIANIDGRLASDIIVDALSSLDLPSSDANFPIPLTFKEQLKRIKSFFIKNKKVDYTTQKFSSLEISEVQDVLDQLKKTTKRFDRVKVVQVGKDGFCFYQE